MAVSVLVPSSIAREAEDKREATRKLGYVARAATVFRADRLIVFPDREGQRRWTDGFVETVLRYAATPPYLRTEVWDTRDELEYAGVLPPLHASAQTGSGSSGPGSSRQGLVTEVGPDGRVRVNCGLQHPISLVAPSELTVEEGERVTVRISSRRPVRAKLVDEPLPGFVVESVDLSEALGREDAGLRIAASRHGVELSVSGLGALAGRIADEGLTLVFGAPERGLPAIIGVDAEDIADEFDSEALDCNPSDREGLGPVEGFDCWLNTIPNQGSETVRTEEAMFASLATLTLNE
jgi:predicted SPOUT superfamily RNA methylase MTH1